MDLKPVQYITVYEKVLAWSTRANDLQGTHDLGFHVLSVSYMILLQLIVNKKCHIFDILWRRKGEGWLLAAVKEIVLSLCRPYVLVIMVNVKKPPHPKYTHPSFSVRGNVGRFSKLCAAVFCVHLSRRQPKHTDGMFSYIY